MLKNKSVPIFRIFLLSLLLALVMPGPRPVTAGDLFAAANDRLAATGIDYRGFLDLRAGRRLVEPVDEKNLSLGEGRLQLEVNGDFSWLLARIKAELVGDAVTDSGGGELREAFLLVSPLPFADLKVGRQIMTWGTGDLLFINDNFPKDWEAFFIGREDEYLKAPADAARLSLFFAEINLDLVYQPRFFPSRYIDGERISYWSPLTGGLAGRHQRLVDETRKSWFADDEFDLRLYRSFNGIEAAFYLHEGYWKTPEGMRGDGRLFFPRLRSLGFSLRGNLLGGLAHAEAGYYDSRDDGAGDDPLIRNSEWRLLLGFEHELGRDFSAGFQYYCEWMAAYDDYRAALPAGSPARDEIRHLLTLRLTKLLLQQNLRLSLFTYYSPSDQDAHLRPQFSYKLTDDWLLSGGANLFFGDKDYTFFGQFADNCNLYLGLRYNF